MTTPTTTTSWLLLQLADGTFPSGGFAHSNGLEATTVLGGLENAGVGAEGTSLDAFLDATLHQIGSSALPFVRAAACDPQRLAELDAAYDATLSMLAPNRASRAQGRALASAASRVWTAPPSPRVSDSLRSSTLLTSVAEHARNVGPSHHAPVFGAIFGTLGIDAEDAVGAYLHGAARNVLSAGVRLGLIGPLEAQGLLAERASTLDAIRNHARAIDPNDTAQTAPLLEIYAALHDRLDGRMFQS
jgi:urease accessory protein